MVERRTGCRDDRRLLPGGKSRPLDQGRLRHLLRQRAGHSQVIPPRGRTNRRPCMKWVTREKVKVDRVACPWLIKKFVDPQAEFLFVPADQVMAVAQQQAAVPYDVPAVELGHHGKECSFD